MRKNCFGNTKNRYCVAAVFLAMFCCHSFSADGPLDVVKKLVTDDSGKKASEKSVPAAPKLNPSRIAEFYAISAFDGALRTGRCNDFNNAGFVIVPTNFLGGKISQGAVLSGGNRLGIGCEYEDTESGMTFFLHEGSFSTLIPNNPKPFPEAGTKVIINSPTPTAAEVCEIYGLGVMKAVRISGESDEASFIGYEVCDEKGQFIGIVTSSEWVYDKNKRADICYVLPSAYVYGIFTKIFNNAKKLPEPKENILAKITPEQLKSYTQAKYMIYMRRYPQAITLLRKLLNSKPINAYAYRQLGDMYFELNDFAPAADCYRKAIELQPELLACYPRMATAMGKTDQPAEALDILIKCAKNIKGGEMKRTFADSFRLIGTDLLESEKPAKAVMALKYADQLSPGNAETCFTLAEALMAADQLPQAREYYCKFLRLAGPVWREYTKSSPSGGDIVMDPRALRAERRIDEIDYKIRMRATQK